MKRNNTHLQFLYAIFKVTGQGHRVTFLGEKIRHALHWFILINPEDISENCPTVVQI
jgi:hypothetical protein